MYIKGEIQMLHRTQFLLQCTNKATREPRRAIRLTTARPYRKETGVKTAIRSRANRPGLGDCQKSGARMAPRNPMNLELRHRSPRTPDAIRNNCYCSDTIM